MTPIRLNDSEWKIVRQEAKQTYINDILGTRPTYDKIKKTRHDVPILSFVQVWGIVTLAILFVVTSFKVAFVTVPYSIQLAEHMLNGYNLPYWVSQAFVGSSIALSIMLATPALILFKLYADDDFTLRKQRETCGRSKFSIEYISPRLSSTLVYLSMAWLFSTSFWGVTGVWDIFLRIIPVIAELGLARLVGDLLAEQRHFHGIVSAAVTEAQDNYDTALAGYETDERYLLVLFQRLRDTIINLVRVDERRRRIQPNLFLAEADGEKVNQFIMDEYKRLTGGQSFAVYAQQLRKERAHGVPIVKTTVIPVADGKRKPPFGDKIWSAESLIRDFEIRELDKGTKYTEADLARDYEEKYNARGAFRAGARDYFTS